MVSLAALVIEPQNSLSFEDIDPLILDAAGYLSVALAPDQSGLLSPAGP